MNQQQPLSERVKSPRQDENTTYETLLQWRDRLVLTILRVMVAVGVPLGIFGIVNAYRLRWYGISGIYIIVVMALLYAAFAPKVDYRLRVGVLLTVVMLVALLNIIYTPLVGDGRLFLFAFIVLAALLLRTKYARFWTAVVFLLYIGAMVRFYVRPVVPDIDRVTKPLYLSLHASTFIALAVIVVASLEFLFNRLLDAITIARKNREELRLSQQRAEQLAEQQRHLAEQMEKVTRLSRAMYRFRDLPSFARELPRLLQEAFDLCRVDLFLANAMLDSLRWIGTSARDRSLKDSLFKPVDMTSPEGKAILLGKPVWEALEGDEGEKCRWLWAFPLSVRGEILGVLLMAFAEEPDQAVRHALSLFIDEMAYAIDALRMFSDLEQRVAQLSRLYGQALLSAAEYERGYRFEIGHLPHEQVERLSEAARRERTYQLEAVENGEGELLAFPLIWRGIHLGTITLLADQWTKEKLTDVSEAGRRLAMVLENTYLLLESRRRALEEETLRTLSDKVWANLSLRSVMETSVRELGRVLSAQDVVLYIEPMALEEV